MSRSRLALLCAFPLILMGCWAYKSIKPHKATTDDLEVEATRVGMIGVVRAGELSLELDIRVKKPLIGYVMGLAAERGPACGGGVMPYRIFQEGTWIQGGRIAADPRLELFGSSKLGCIFGHDEVEERGLLRDVPTVLDLKILGGKPDGSSYCIRVPVAHSTEPDEWEYMPSWFMGMGYRLQGFSRMVGRLDWSGAIVFRLGRWLGPVRLRAELGYWLSREDIEDASRRRKVHFVPSAIAADAFVLRLGQSGIGVELGYELTTVIPNSSVDGPVYLHGPRLGLKYLKYPRPPDWPAFRTKEEGQSFGIEFYFTYLLGEGDAAGALGFGVAIVGDYGF